MSLEKYPSLPSQSLKPLGAMGIGHVTNYTYKELPPPQALSHLRGGLDYPEQPTAWLAGYHVLQRYGAYEALQRFTDVFDETGAFRAPTKP